MPNHCSNSLTVSGLGASDFFAKVEAGGENFCNTFIPVPDIMLNINSGSCKIDGEVVHAWREIDGKSVAISAVDHQHMMDLYGCDNSYDFANMHWGTKWGGYDETVNSDEGYITFDSAWAPPLTAVEQIARMFPRATFQLSYAEGGSAYYGQTTFSGGVVIDQWESNEFWRPLEEGEEVDEDADYMDGLTPACAEFLESHGLHTGG